jgi:hypothetical protein
MSSLRNIRKDMRKQNVSVTRVEPATTPVKLELSGPVRKPTLTEKNNFFKQITFDPKCPICAEVVWNDTHKDTILRQKLFARHAFKKHLLEEMKVCPTFLDFFISLITIRCFQICSPFFALFFSWPFWIVKLKRTFLISSDVLTI